jgi:hypothetical protein
MAGIKDNISEHNAKCYMDIAKDMYVQKKGVFTFIVRIDGKKIVDYVQLESINYGEASRTKDN